MRYLSTRGHPERRRFSDILLEGLAPDGGLFLPESYPQVDAATLARWRRIYHEQGYAELAFQILSLYIDDIPADDLRALCAKTYTAEVFGTGEIVPLRHLEDGLWLEALSNGPTLAFKDMAMQLLGHLFEYELARRGETLNILGATSGDTGSAAEYAMRGKRGIRVFMLSPHGRMSPFQQAQMYSLMDANIHNIAIEGVFDDCQDIVKAVSHDLDFKRRFKIGTVNSINWARLLAQVVYYFAGWIQATTRDDEPVSFAVPSGNFGNVCAGHIARMMGLPIAHLVVATNENDVLDEFFRTGVYRVRGSADTYETSSPSMDISKASNFERFVFDLLGRDAAATRALFADELARHGRFDLSAYPAFALARSRFGFLSGRSTHANRIATIRDTWQRFGVVIDPHTADGVKVAREHRQPGVPMIVLETALPVKFAATIVEALGREPERPARYQGIEADPSGCRCCPRTPSVSRPSSKRCARRGEGQAMATTSPTASARPGLMALEEALQRLLADVTPVAEVERVPTQSAAGRVLAEPVVSGAGRTRLRQQPDGWLRRALCGGTASRGRGSAAAGGPAHPGGPRWRGAAPGRGGAGLYRCATAGWG
jgi:threonine synthase